LKEEAQQVLRDLLRDRVEEHQRSLFLGRLIDLARVCEWRQNVEGARLAAATAEALVRGEEPGSMPFFLALAERSLTATVEMQRRGEDLERTRYRPLRRYQG
jgi:hypothetical protein